MNSNKSIGNLDNIRMILENDSMDINMPDSNNWTCLMEAVKYCDVELIKGLLNRKAKIDIRDNNGQTVLFHLMMKLQNPSNFKACDQIFQLFSKQSDFEVNIRDKFKGTPLTIAIRKKNYYFVEKLLFYGALFDIKTDLHNEIDSNISKLLVSRGNWARRKELLKVFDCCQFRFDNDIMKLVASFI